MPTFTLTGYRWTGTYYGNPSTEALTITIDDDDGEMNWFGDDTSDQTVTTSDGRHSGQLVSGGSLLGVRMDFGNDGSVDSTEPVAFFLVTPPYDWYFIPLPGSAFQEGDTLLGNDGMGWVDSGEGFTYEEVTCFTKGTRITTPDGARRIETLKLGDLVQTRDNGPQPLRWIGETTVPAMGKLAPVVFAPGAIGNTKPLAVSPQHRMLLSDWRAPMFYGAEEVFVRAIDLVDGVRVKQVPGGMVTYVHLLFDSHQVLRANGAYSESLYLGDVALGALPPESVSEVCDLFPALATPQGNPGKLARPALRRYEVACLPAA